MLSFLAMMFTLHLGLGAAPTDGAVASLRDASLAVAAAHAEAEPAASRAAEVAGALAPPRRQLSQRDWKRILAEGLRNESLANAAMWVASQPLRVSVKDRKFFVTVRVATP